jgi:putative acyl-CoA dehydrogenase
VGGATHEVTNQPPPLEGYNLFETDRPLAEAVRREGTSWSATVPGRTER